MEAFSGFRRAYAEPLIRELRGRPKLPTRLNRAAPPR
jgi:hypothetical protein